MTPVLHGMCVSELRRSGEVGGSEEVRGGEGLNPVTMIPFSVFSSEYNQSCSGG